MKESALIQASIELLQHVLTDRQPADHLARLYFKSRRYIGAKDRKVISENVFQALRLKSSLSWWIGNHLPVDPRRLILTFLAFKNGYTSSEISRLFAETPYGAGPLSPAEMGYLKTLQSQDYYQAAMPFSVRWDIPSWAEPWLQEAFGDKIKEQISVMLENAPLDVRVNALKTHNTEAEAFFCTHNIPFEKLDAAPHAYRIARGTSLSQADYFKAGGLEVQDLGSQMVVEACKAGPEMQILDYCAGAGGKTLGLAAAMKNKGCLIACDTSSVRLKQCKVRLKRAGVQNTQVRLLDADTAQWLKRQRDRFDRVLVDVPCSGSGTWRRNPDLKWRMTENDVHDLRLLQKEILQKVAPLVKTGGWLVYATCSLFSQENEQQVAEFIEYAPEFTLKSQERLSPFLTSTDGFYCAILVKKPA